MNTEVKTNEPISEGEVSTTSLEVAHSNSAREKHLEGLAEDEKKVIRLMANIFVKGILGMSEK